MVQNIERFCDSHSFDGVLHQTKAMVLKSGAWGKEKRVKCVEVP